MEEKKTCCFFGHRKIAASDGLREKLYNIIEDLIIYIVASDSLRLPCKLIYFAFYIVILM